MFGHRVRHSGRKGSDLGRPTSRKLKFARTGLGIQNKKVPKQTATFPRHIDQKCSDTSTNLGDTHIFTRIPTNTMGIWGKKIIDRTPDQDVQQRFASDSGARLKSIENGFSSRTDTAAREATSNARGSSAMRLNSGKTDPQFGLFGPFGNQNRPSAQIKISHDLLNNLLERSLLLPRQRTAPCIFRRMLRVVLPLGVTITRSFCFEVFCRRSLTSVYFTKVCPPSSQPSRGGLWFRMRSTTRFFADIVILFFWLAPWVKLIIEDLLFSRAEYRQGRLIFLPIARPDVDVG